MVQSVEKPRIVTVNRQAGLLIIEWQEGHHSEYPLSGIRAVCPCVSCRGGHAEMAQPIARSQLFAQPNGSSEIQGAELVGAYAISFTWADGHNTGIYTWGLLRGLCPCAECERAFRDA